MMADTELLELPAVIYRPFPDLQLVFLSILIVFFFLQFELQRK
jgi:hypothetical protein